MCKQRLVHSKWSISIIITHIYWSFTVWHTLLLLLLFFFSPWWLLQRWLLESDPCRQCSLRYKSQEEWVSRKLPLRFQNIERKVTPCVTWLLGFSLPMFCRKRNSFFTSFPQTSFKPTPKQWNLPRPQKRIIWATKAWHLLYKQSTSIIGWNSHHLSLGSWRATFLSCLFILTFFPQNNNGF